MKERPFGNHEITSRHTLSSFRIDMSRSGNNSLLPEEFATPLVLVRVSTLRSGVFDIPSLVVSPEQDVFAMLRLEWSSTTIGAVEHVENVASAVAASTRWERPCGSSSE